MTVKKLVKSNKHMTMKTVIAGHEVRGLFVLAVVSAIEKQLPTRVKHGKKDK